MLCKSSGWPRHSPLLYDTRARTWPRQLSGMFGDRIRSYKMRCLEARLYIITTGKQNFNHYRALCYFSRRHIRWRQFAWNVKTCFLEKMKEKSVCRLLKIMPRVPSVKQVLDLLLFPLHCTVNCLIVIIIVFVHCTVFWIKYSLYYIIINNYYSQKKSADDEFVIIFLIFTHKLGFKQFHAIILRRQFA